jgi:hypothetical protein
MTQQLTAPEAVAEAYLSAWNETDATARRTIIDATWAADATYADPLATVCGAGEIAGLIAAVQDRFPGFRFALVGRPDGHGEHVRFTWGLGPHGAEPVVVGTDYVRLAEGRLAAVTGFLDKVPQ